jgi:hypothetical protein
VTVRVLAMIVVNVRVVFVRPRMWVGVAQRAMTVQIVLDKFVGGGWHGLEC